MVLLLVQDLLDDPTRGRVAVSEPSHDLLIRRDRHSFGHEILHEFERLRPVELTPYVQAQSARFAAKLGALQPSGAGVEAGFKAAEEKFRQLGVPFWLAVTLLEHGEWFSADGRAPVARPLFEEARGIFEGLA